jgi:hypothetical protein
MGIAEEIARKRNELANFVAESAKDLLAAEMAESARGAAAVDLLHLMIASGPRTPAPPIIDVTPAPAASLAAPPAAEEIVAASAPAPKKTGRGARKFTDAELIAAVYELGDTAAIAERFGCTVDLIQIHRRRLCIAGKRGRVAAPKIECTPVAPPEGGVSWTPENIGRLRAMATQSPRPPTEEIAAVFGTSKNAIQSAMSRFDITKRQGGSTGYELKDLSAFKERKCMSCARPFLSEGIHNRRCTTCKSNDHRVAA